MTPEGIVVAEVERYFSQPKFQKFSTKQEYQIKMGSDKRRADVVLINSKGNLAAIAECKRQGVEANGVDQLKSYLSATDTPLGIFANTTEPDSWNFYENLGKNRFRKIDTRVEFEKRVVKSEENFVTSVLGLFRKFFQPKPNEPSKNSPDEESTETERGVETVESTPSVTPPKPSINYTIKDRPLQNEHRENTVEPSLNGKPYYSEENGFYWAANHQGIAECLPQHIKRIIHNEELEIASTRDELEQEIDALREDVVELEEQRRECEQTIGERAEELAEKKEDLAGLEVQLKTLKGPGTEPVRIETTSDDSNPESFNASAAEVTSNHPIIQQHEEIDVLIQEKVDLEQAIGQKNQALSGKKEELAGLEVELQGPTEIELNPPAVESLSDYTSSAKHRVSKISLITAVISTVFFIFLAIYLFIFYASAVDKAFFLNTEAIQEQLAQGTYAGVNDVVNPSALSKAFQGEWNLFVVMFPFVFLAFAIALDYFWEQGKWGYLVALVLAGLTLLFDGILAIQISQKIHQAKILMGQETEQWNFRVNDLNMWTVIFCGFIVSLLVSITYHVTNQRWKAVIPIQEQSKVEYLHAVEIKSEKTQRAARLAVLKTELENLQSDIEQLNEKNKTMEEKIIKAIRTPIDSQIAILTTQTDNLESEIERLNRKRTDLEQEINKTRSEIEKSSMQLNKRVVNRNRMESQVNQFLNGWCRFVAHSGDGISDVSDEIGRIKQVANETLDFYYQSVPGYSDSHGMDL